MPKKVILGVIPARGGSRRVPRKNLKLLGGRPLIAWTIEAAKAAQSLHYFLVSTEDDEIAEISSSYGAEVPFKRPMELASDCDTTLVLQHALEWYEENKHRKVSHIVCLQCTSPFRTANDIDQCVQLALTIEDAETVISVSHARQHAYWMFEMDVISQRLTPFIDIDLEGKNLVSQLLPPLWYPNGAVYVTRRDVLLDGRIFGDKIYGHYMVPERSVDLEEELDFIVCSALIPTLKEGKPWTKISWSPE